MFRNPFEKFRPKEAREEVGKENILKIAREILNENPTVKEGTREEVIERLVFEIIKELDRKFGMTGRRIESEVRSTLAKELREDKTISEPKEPEDFPDPDEDN